jgi:hypothetical protein
MRTILLSALFAAGIGLAGLTGAAAAPGSPALPGAAPASLVTPAQVVIVGPRHRYRHRVCRPVRRCWRGRHGRLICRVQTVCHWRRW